MKHSTPSAPPPALAFLEDALQRLDQAGLLRARPPVQPLDGVNLCSNDYLGLADATAEAECAVAGHTSMGAGASRLVSGEHAAHVALEDTVAGWLGTERALVFTSGYAANVGVVSALAGPEDLILSDALNHASLIDGCRLSRAEVLVYPHLDVDAVRRALGGGPGRRAWVVTESYFSMDADSPDLVALRRACDTAGAALVVDEAHALGVLGPDGRGICASRGIVPDVLVGTFGKAFGAGGAFVAGCDALIAWLWNRARSFVFSTGLSPVVAEGARRRLELARRDPSLREAALARATELRSGMERRHLDVRGHGVIVPWLVGDSRRALLVADRLRAQGFFVQAIRPPTVPEGTTRLRLTATARHTQADIQRTLQAIDVAWDPSPLPSSSS